MKGTRPLNNGEIRRVSAAFTGTFEVRNRGLFMIGVSTGGRISELLSLRIGDVFQNQKPVGDLLYGKSIVKGGEVSRSVPVNADGRKSIRTRHPKGRVSIKEIMMKTEIMMTDNFEEKFAAALEEELKGFDIDRSLVEIKHVRYQATLKNALPVKLGEYAVRMRVVGAEGEIPEMEIDNWFRSHKFIYAIMSKYVEPDFEPTDMITFDAGTIKSIALKIRDAFRDFQPQ